LAADNRKQAKRKWKADDDAKKMKKKVKAMDHSPHPLPPFQLQLQYP